jgi:poly(A) polymerase Pap1/uncharacterized protein (UPF0248 family)/endonuclease/exonuclease/phosphatase family metal-dependent hydrolase
MASTTPTSSSSAHMSTSSYDTALCVIPPQDQCSYIDSLRSPYDKSFATWPPHINLVYPFVAPELLQRAVSQIQSHLSSDSNLHGPTIELNTSGYFEHRNNSTIFRCESVDPAQSALSTLRSAALRALGQEPSPSNFHLTVGQSDDDSQTTRDFLLSKANLLPTLVFDVGSLAVLVRERSTDNVGRMRLWSMIDLPSSQPSSGIPIPEFWLPTDTSREMQSSTTEDETELRCSSLDCVQAGTTYRLDHSTGLWSPAPFFLGEQTVSKFNVSSYNVLVDSEDPPARDRYELLVETILSEAAVCDILVLQEVSDEFLSFMLASKDIQHIYPYTSHGPPSQADIGPLPSLRNVVILSQYQFRWEYLPFQRRHKGAIVASFPPASQGAPPLVVGGVHLTCGLTDGSVAAKKVQLSALISHLSRLYAPNPWIVAGDFNITTSKYTIKKSVKRKSITPQTATTLESISTQLIEAGLLDCWMMARLQGNDESEHTEMDDLFEGEEGATFNPCENALAAATSGTSINRPQRYDRILVRSKDELSITQFCHFGQPKTIDGITSVPSDHWGVSATLDFGADPHRNADSADVLKQASIEYRLAPTQLPTWVLQTTLAHRGVFPTMNEQEQYKNAFALIKDILLRSPSDEESSASDVPMIIIPVGSYALGVWNASSDIDCLCIGSISSKTFFRLAIQRIYRARARDVKVIRRVKARTGTMLELSVTGVRMDLQYCPAAGVVSRWSEFSTLQPSDPIFNLPILSLRKLKPIRDLQYIRHSIPFMAPFRLAYHFIKLWAMKRGLYSAKFGYLGGIHITLMLSWICKRLTHNVGSISAGDIIVSFFHHYANFNWKKNMLFDTFFHKKIPRYQRSVREPMVILGFHAPNSNIAHTATAAGVQVLVHELQRADARLSQPHMSWDSFFDEPDSADGGAKEFLAAYDSYVRIDIQYWGRSLHKGRGLVGWVESRCINLVVDIHKALPHLFVRIWPARFADSNTGATEAYYHGCYLIGMSRIESRGVTDTKEDRAHAKAAIEKTFERFLTQVKGDDKYFDESSSWIGVSLAKSSDLKDLDLDSREWGDDAMYIEPDSEDEDENPDEDDEVAAPTRKVPIRRDVSPSSIQAPVSSSKLRPASDLLNRLRWDPSLDPSEYIVGYEDRFLGAKETGLERWKTEQTDDEFIPQHRILYFKKKGEGGGKIVWERATRIDRIFGSGAGDGNGAEN